MVIEPIKKSIVINGRVYQFQLLGSRKRGKLANKLMSKAVGLMASYPLSTGADNFYACMVNALDDQTTEDLYEFAFAQEAMLTCDNKPIIDIDMHFQGKYLEMMQLCLFAFRVNCEDFFTFIGGLLSKEGNLLKILKIIVESQGLPPEVQNLLQSFLPQEAN